MADLTRINFDVDSDTNDVLNQIIPFAMKSEVYRKLTDVFIRDSSKYPSRTLLLAIIDGKAEIKIVETSDES